MSADRLWYSSFSTGIFEVDNQHGNIDVLVDIIAKSESGFKELLHELELVIIAHFEYEEQLLGDKLPADHLEAHTIFLAELQQWISKVINGDISAEVFTDIIHMNLLEHVRHFDFFLKKHLEE